MRTVVLWCALLAVAGCKVDGDGDGALRSADCDDSNPNQTPGAPEVCNGVDDNCNGSTDEDPVDGTLSFIDLDNDGFGDRDTAGVMFCTVPGGFVALDSTDCDDDDARVSPLNVEICNGLDDNCDSTIDEGFSVQEWYRDVDGDGFGDPADPITACVPPEGYVDTSDDCDDTSPDIFPGAPELCNGLDDDCNLEIDDAPTDATEWYADTDDDGFGDELTALVACDAPDGFVAALGDCNDVSADVYPGAIEVCNSVDDDCNELIDDGVVGAPDWYLDGDSDGFGLDTDVVAACDAPTGYVGTGGDCDDTSTLFFPGAPETDCTDLNDYNCDGSVAFTDADVDGFAACEECDDADPNRFPGATDVCNGIDDDCDLAIDEDAAASAWYQDLDGDTFGSDASRVDGCVSPGADYIAIGGDCDDTDITISPLGTELCNGLDDNCDTVIDNGGIDGVTYYADGDGDGYGDAASSTVDCSLPAGFVLDSTDCDDIRLSVYPGATEICDGFDNDCDLRVDIDAVDGFEAYPDADGDTYGDLAAAETVCAGVVGYIADSTDCDDTLSAVNPAATEICDNGLDDNCDASSGACRRTGSFGPADADAVVSETTEALMGFRVSAADLDADGVADLISGAVSADGYAGKVWLNYGPTATSTPVELTGVAANDLAGYDVASLGDLDADGFEDAGVVALGPDSYAGSLYILYGGASPIASGSLSSFPHVDGGAANDQLASAHDAVDIFGDGLPDLIVGSVYASEGAALGGSVYLINGDGSRLSGSTAAPDAAVATLTGFDLYSFVGDARSTAAGDMDGDGLSDIMAGAWDTNGTGAGPYVAGLYLFYADPALVGTFSVESGDFIATIPTSALRHISVASSSDLDGDGTDDTVVGVEGLASAEFSEIFVYYGGTTRRSGSASLNSSDARFLGAGSDDAFSIALGDLTGDSVGEIVVGSPLYDGVLTDGGQARVFPGGAYTGVYAIGSSDWSIFGDTSLAYLGWSVDAGHDLSGDGIGDLVISEPEGTFSGNGNVYVFNGQGW
jgi:hypothetical protein